MVATKADLFNRLHELDISVTTFEHRPVFTVDLKKLRHLIGSRHLSFCRETILEEVLGVKAGAVTPFALINDHEKRVNVVLDSNILEHELLNFHPLENTSTTTIRSSDLVHFINGCGHSPQILDLHSYG